MQNGEIHGVDEAFSLREEGARAVLVSVSLVLALSAIALSVVVLMQEDFMGNNRHTAQRLGKSVPVVDDAVQRLREMQPAATGNIQK